MQVKVGEQEEVGVVQLASDKKGECMGPVMMFVSVNTLSKKKKITDIRAIFIFISSSISIKFEPESRLIAE